MRRTALLIGAQTSGLTGVDFDVQSMAGALERQRFTTVTCTGPQATRDGIIAAYDRLIDGAGPDDVCFVYYSGHGGLVRPPVDDPDGPDGLTLPERQFIVPSDFEETKDGDFRGITSIELSVKLAELTRRTGNVAVAFDCCHSAHMTRDLDLRPRALLHSTHYDAIGEHLAGLERRGLRKIARDLEGNREAVRLMACEPQQSAYEYTNAKSVRTGVMTESLVLALDEVGALPVTWSTVAEVVRRRVTTLVAAQWPAVEGPSGRLLFTTEELGALASLPVVPRGRDEIELRGAALLNVQVGDEFAIMPAGAERADDATKLADAEVTALGPMTAMATLRPVAGRVEPARLSNDTGLPEGVRAHRTRSLAPELPVRLPDAGSFAADLRRAVEYKALVRVAAPGEETTVEVRADAEGRIAVHDRIGRLHPWYVATEAGILDVADNLQRLAKATALRTLGDSEAVREGFDRVTVEWGRVVDGQMVPAEPSGSVVYVGEKVYVRVRNDTDEKVYVSLVDIGLTARITLLTSSDTGGMRIGPHREYIFGRDAFDNSVPGVAPDWPVGLDTDAARPELILAIITAEPLDVSMLEQLPMREAKKQLVPSGGSSLEQMLTQLGTGETRDLRNRPPSIRYAVRGIDFTLSPARPPAPEAGGFLVDDRPEPSVRMFVPRGPAQRSRRVAVRIDDLVVHKNKALFGADVRLDALVLTGGDKPDEPVYHVRTERFPNVRDGDRLPLDQLLMYHGPATDFLDLAVWVTRDTSGSLALSDMLRQEFTSHDVQVAGVQLASLALTAPHAALAVGALGAATVIGNVAYKLLLGVTGTSIGLYRTSLLAHEDFGIGPVPHFRHAQDVSFAFSVTDVS
ncbi:caspase family protein [Dactylosporangium sp. NPDC051541]|uniref:caspase family protein n=1 Tax=Dactylosporangium sp. NPDC051541 TaxID=3363977 RepID=UPI00379382DF